MQQNHSTLNPITANSIPSAEQQHIHHIHQQPQQQQQQQQQQQSSTIQLQNDGSDRTLINQQEVDKFLAQCGLSQYYQVFIEEGFDRPESLLEITESDLIQMQVKRGHRRLLQRAVANAKGIPSSVPLNITPITNKELTGECYASRNVAFRLPYRMISTASDTGYSQPQLSQQQQQPPPPHLSQHQQPSPPVPPPHASQQPGKKSMQPAEAMDVSLHALAGASPLNTSSGSSSSATSSSAAQPEYFPSAGTMTQNQSGMSSTEEEAVTSDNVHRLWKRKYHRHAKPDTNAPLKPPSAYVMFSNDVRAELKQQNKSFTDLAKIIGDRWKNISPEGKELYETNALRAREDYLKKIEEYQKTESFRKYQQYISDFKAENEAAARPVGRPRKRHRRDGELSDGGTASDSTRQARASSISSQPDDQQAQQQTLAQQQQHQQQQQQQQANNHHSRTHSVSSDQRHYPFYLLNEVGLQQQRQQTSPQPLNTQLQQQQQQQQQQQTSPRSSTSSERPASTTSGSISSSTPLSTPSSK
ncbi:hypothetical protein V8B55DRAFT_1497653 [Mucor lusitanicus]